MGRLNTLCLMGGLFLIFMFVGNLLGGAEGMKVAFWAAAGMNFYSYFFSDKLVLKQYKAQEVNEKNAPELYDIVRRLAEQAKLPMPKVYIIPEQVPNAFATGRNPKHAAVAATQGLLNSLSKEEIEGVLAQEMSHVKHYDILTGSIAAVFAGAITYLGRFAQMNTNTSRTSRSKGPAVLVAAVLMPIAAMIIRMSISRTREFAADEGAARLTGHPEWLMAALAKLEDYAQHYQMQNASSQTSHMFIVNPFSGLSGGLANLFATHPSTKDRIERLAQLKKEIG